MTSPKLEDRRAGGFTFAGATLAVLAVVFTLAQYAAFASLGLIDRVELRISTGGVIVLVASIVMWVKCRTWGYWRKWIWPWAGTAVLLSFVTVNLVAAQDARALEEESRAAQQSVEAAEETAQACDDLYVQIQDKALTNDAMATAEEGDWRAILWEYARRGDDGLNEYERELKVLQDEYRRTC